MKDVKVSKDFKAIIINTLKQLKKKLKEEENMIVLAQVSKGKTDK